MSISTRYFQLTSEILVEYNYTGLTIVNDQSGTQSNMFDLLKHKAYIINSKFDGSRNFLLDSDKSSFVVPVNVSESQFTQCVKTDKYGQTTEFWDRQSELTKEVVSPSTSQDDIVIDNFKLHFTSRNYLGSYDGFILRVSVYDNKKNKISLLSHYIQKTDNLEINQDPMLINQKLYTTYLEFTIPSVNALLNTSLASETYLKGCMEGSYEILENTPLIFTLYGIKNTYEYNQFEKYRTEKLNTIYVPIQNSYNNVSIHLAEAEDGDYFEIYPEVNDGSESFSDFISKESDGTPENYIILHQLSLTEYYTNSLNNVLHEVTHREQYIVNAAVSLEDGTVEINEDELDRTMIYRPVLLHGGKLAKFVIEDEMKILNTLDNTTTVITGSCDSSEINDCNPKKYGKVLNKIYLGSIPAQVNVYNKRTDEDTDYIKITNGGSNVTIENHQHSIIGFIECANVGVTVEQIPISSLSV